MEQFLIEQSLGKQLLSRTNVAAQARCHIQYSRLAETMRTVSGTTRTEAKLEALSWLRRQLRWESTLEHLRHGGNDLAKAA